MMGMLGGLNAEVCAAMDVLNRVALDREWPEGSEMWKLRRMAQPTCLQDYGLSVDPIKAAIEAGLFTQEDVDRFEAKQEQMTSLCRSLGKSLAAQTTNDIMEVIGA